MKTITIWDLPLRLFHWLLVICTIAAVITAKIGGNLIVWHGRLGLCILGLLFFRLCWGFFGNEFALFSQFFPSIQKIKAYLSGNWHKEGHNPIGAFSVFALLIILLVQAISGLFSNDELSYYGYLSSFISDQIREKANFIHQINQLALFSIIILHIVAIFFYKLVKKQNLITPMLTGKKEVADTLENPKTASKLALIVIIALSFALVILIANTKEWFYTPQITINKAADW